MRWKAFAAMSVFAMGLALISGGHTSSVTTPVETAFTSLGRNLVIAYGYDPASASPWKAYDPKAPPFANQLKEVEPLGGYFVHVNQDVDFTVGLLSKRLKAGWNLVGWPGAVTTPAPTPTPTPSPALIPTPIAVSSSPLPVHGFVVGDKPFQFLGAESSARDPWSKAKDIDLVKDARAHGITVLEMEVPLFEDKLGHYDESYLVGLDHLLDTANKNGVYVTLPFIHAYGIALEPGNPYYHPGGIEGLIKNQELKEAFKRRMAELITRVNTVNGRKYSEDPTIMAWVLAKEIISAPENYPKGPPKVTVAELAAWVEEMAAYVKRLDPNHLVTLNTHSGLGKVGEDWFRALTAPSLDFVNVEDAEARFLKLTQEPVDFYLKVFTMNKPVVMMISFTGGALNKLGIDNDYFWQSEKLKEIFKVYYEMGVAAGFTIFSWASDLDRAYQQKGAFAYTASNQPIAQAFLDIASTLGPRNSTTTPLEFIRLHP